MGPEDSSTRSQWQVTSPYPEPDQTSPHPPNRFLYVPLYYYPPHLHLDLQSGLTLTHLQQNSAGTPSTPIHATCPVHLILLDSIIRITHSLFICNVMFPFFWKLTLHHLLTVADVSRQYRDPVLNGWMSKKTFGHSTLENETIMLSWNVRHQPPIDAASYLSAKE
jgi:hypothetical protein